MEPQVCFLGMRIGINVVEPARVERAGAADDPVHFVVLAEQELGQVPEPSCPVIPVISARFGIAAVAKARQLSARTQGHCTPHLWSQRTPSPRRHFRRDNFCRRASMLRMKSSLSISRRRFLATTATAAAALAAPRVLTAQKSEKQLVIGEGEHRYEVLHNWAQLPDKYRWQTTHNVAVDRDGQSLRHPRRPREPERSSLDLRLRPRQGNSCAPSATNSRAAATDSKCITEGSEQFLYVTGYQQLKNFAKLTLKGEQVWEKRAPMDSDVYAARRRHRSRRNAGAATRSCRRTTPSFPMADSSSPTDTARTASIATTRTATGSRCSANPATATASSTRLMASASTTAGARTIRRRRRPREQTAAMVHPRRQTPQDPRRLHPSRESRHARDVILVPDLSARVTLLDKDDKVIAHLGEDPEWREQVLKDGNETAQQSRTGDRVGSRQIPASPRRLLRSSTATSSSPNGSTPAASRN